METINLVKNGIFPIVYDEHGNKLSLPNTGYDIPGTVQGEGKLVGVPCLFIRTSGCNLRCMWFTTENEGSPCDTPFSSFQAEKNKLNIEKVVNIVRKNCQNISHVVISGGEPLLQKNSLAKLLFELKTHKFHTTVETNATIYDDRVALFTDLISMSPKLRNSIPTQNKFVGKTIDNLGLQYNEKWETTHSKRRIAIDVMQKYIDKAQMYKRDFQIKFVVNSLEDIDEIKNILQQLSNFRQSDIIIMPEGTTKQELDKRAEMLVPICLENGWRFVNRMHTYLFNNKRGV